MDADAKRELSELVEACRIDPDASVATVARFVGILRRLRSHESIQEALRPEDVRLIRDHAPEAYDELAERYGLLMDA